MDDELIYVIAVERVLQMEDFMEVFGFFIYLFFLHLRNAFMNLCSLC